MRLRIFERYGGRCHWSGILIRPGDDWDCDHVIALTNGGENRERNMAPILRGKPHKDKTKQDVAEKSKVYKKRAYHLGLKDKPSRLKSRGFEGVKPQRTASTPINKWRGYD
ncbi:HNH endonuclease [Bradyrhizobium septentrionale]|uniref:HNH endonuclease n=1 Tax=Bradyrhizobium septentrionale TaxID=1404411 RepID=UPI001AEF18CF|nr:HNH endonuclease [Bradyrhizobium septentrionale]UGY23845.1 HNH endonuclease [Bradyrhizobium septentrionale]